MMEIGEKVKIINGPDEGKTGTVLEANIYHMNYMVKIDEPDGGSKFQRIGAEALVSMNPNPPAAPDILSIAPVVKTRTTEEKAQGADAPEENKTQESAYAEPAVSIPVPDIALQMQTEAPVQKEPAQKRLPRVLSQMSDRDIEELKSWIEKTVVKTVEVYMRARSIQKPAAKWHP